MQEFKKHVLPKLHSPVNPRGVADEVVDKGMVAEVLVCPNFEIKVSQNVKCNRLVEITVAGIL